MKRVKTPGRAFGVTPSMGAESPLRSSLWRRRFGKAGAGTTDRRPWVGPLVLALASLFWLVVALHVTGPLVLADEYVYLVRGMALDRLDRLAAIAPSAPSVGNYLFLRILNLFSRAHLPVEMAAKLFNVACFVLAAHLIGVRILRIGAAWRAAALFALVAFLPLGSYVAYVMPESLYLLIFVTLFSRLVGASGANLYRLWAIAGGLVAVLTLAKAHGLFVLAAFLGATMVWSAITGRIALAKAAALCLTALAAFAATLLVGIQLLGPSGGAPGEDVVGSFYWSVVTQSAVTWTRLAATADFAAMQASAILLLLAPSLTFLVFGIAADRRRRDRGAPSPGLLSFSACFLIGLLSLVVLVVAFLLGAEPDRIQLRYVNFAFPCVLALAWIWQADRPDGDTRGFRLTAAAVWLLATAAFLYRAPSLRPLAADSPEMFFSYRGGEFGAFGLGASMAWFAGGLIAACAGALLHPKVRWFDAQVLSLLVLGVIANVNTLTWQGLWSASQAPLRAVGEAARAACGPAETDVVAIGTPGAAGQLYTAMASLGRLAPLQMDAKTTIDPTVPRANGCVVTSQAMDAVWGRPLARGPGVSLYRPRTTWRVESTIPFDAGTRPSILGTGWSAPELRGIWTDGREATLRVDPPAAGDEGPIVVELDAVAFTPPPRSTQRVEVSADGRSLATWSVQEGAYYVRLPATAAPGRPVELHLRLPDALAPASVLPGVADRRLLGIGVRRLKVLRPSGGAVAPGS